MRTALHIAIALAVIGVCAWGVIWQFSDNASPDIEQNLIQPLAIGDLLEVDFTLRDMDPIPKPRNLMAWYGRGATVLYTWSVPCPCVEDLEPRMRKVHERFNHEKNGVRWVALAGEPEDTREAIREKMDRVGVFYPVLRDPDQRVCRQLDLVHAGQVAVLDPDGRLVFRGSPDDDYFGGGAEALVTALEAVLAGRPVEPAETPRAYGCAFSVPLSCLTLEEDAEEPAR